MPLSGQNRYSSQDSSNFSLKVEGHLKAIGKNVPSRMAEAEKKNTSIALLTCTDHNSSMQCYKLATLSERRAPSPMKTFKKQFCAYRDIVN